MAPTYLVIRGSVAMQLDYTQMVYNHTCTTEVHVASTVQEVLLEVIVSHLYTLLTFNNWVETMHKRESLEYCTCSYKIIEV